VGDQAHLDYLYVLTVADLRGTNPKLWNAWKARLFEEFYERTKRALRRGLETPLDQDELIREMQASALAKIPSISQEKVKQVWSQWTDAYFLRYSPEEIAWHTSVLADRHPYDETPLVAIRQLVDRGGTAVLTYAPRRLHSFARTTAVLDQMGLNIVDARLITSANGFSLETYVVLEDNGAVIAEPTRIREIERGLWRNLQQPEDSPLTVTRRAPRQVRMFSTPTQVNFSLDSRNNRTILELIAADRPGLLSEVGKVFKAQRVAVNGAKIMTVGERAEDVFYITDMEGRVLQETACQQVQESLIRALDRRDAART
jgi:[protein-PII] uridylyltransferase